MKGDFTRDTFDPTKHYQQVLQQQGRVQLDADWNEQAAIAARRDETITRDLVGHCGGPADGAAFGIFTDHNRLTEADENALTARFGALPADLQPVELTGDSPTFALTKGADFFLSPGRYYVDGIQCENHFATPFTAQPDRTMSDPLEKGVTYLIYLDVWRRHLTAVDDETIRESALGGPETATRLKTVWQVRAVKFEGGPARDKAACVAQNTEFEKLTASSTGQLRARTTAAGNDDPCQLPETSGYKGLENQLYRVEIHDGRSKTWKWSRENGSIVTRITKIDNNAIEGKGVITVASLGRDEATSFRKGSFVEILDDRRELEGLPGQLLEVEDVDPDKLTLTLRAPATLLGPAPDGLNLVLHPKLRRWEGHGAISSPGWLTLEAGIEIAFETRNVVYRTGDYWLIPARTATADAPDGDIEWPRELDADGEPRPLFRPKHGGHHHYCRLGVVRVEGDGKIKTGEINDCRCLWPSLTSVPQLFYVSGDGQEVAAIHENAHEFNGRTVYRLRRPLIVAVANGHCFGTMGNSLRVRFVVTDGTGMVALPGDSLRSQVDILLGPNGLAQCDFYLDSLKKDQQVTARLLTPADEPSSLPLIFNATLNDPNPIRIVDIRYGKSAGNRLNNDQTIGLEVLSGARDGGGLHFLCDQEIDGNTVLDGVPDGQQGIFRFQPTCFVTVEIPFPLTVSERELAVWDAASGFANFIGYRPIILDATVQNSSTIAKAKNVKGAISWIPGPAIKKFIEQVFDLMQKNLQPRPTKLLARVTLKGNFIWGAGNPPGRFLDGDVFRAASSPTIEVGHPLLLPSGDGRRGGDFEMWFWLLPPDSAPPIPPPVPPPQLLVTPSGQLRLVAHVNTGDTVSIDAIEPSDEREIRIEKIGGGPLDVIVSVGEGAELAGFVFNPPLPFKSRLTDEDPVDTVKVTFAPKSRMSSDQRTTLSIRHEGQARPDVFVILNGGMESGITPPSR